MNPITNPTNLCRLPSLSHARCTACLSPLELHQPDEQLPTRLLGTCSRCRSWFLIDAVEKVMVPLPDSDALILG